MSKPAMTSLPATQRKLKHFVVRKLTTRSQSVNTVSWQTDIGSQCPFPDVDIDGLLSRPQLFWMRWSTLCSKTLVWRPWLQVISASVSCQQRSQFIEDIVEPSFFLPGIISLFIMCIGIIRNNSLVCGRARAESNPGHWARHALLHMAAGSEHFIRIVAGSWIHPGLVCLHVGSVPNSGLLLHFISRALSSLYLPAIWLQYCQQSGAAVSHHQLVF